MYVYQARVEKDADGRWSAWVEELPGCATWGYSQDEALAALNEAVAVYIADMIAAGEDVAQIANVAVDRPIVAT